MPQSTMLVITYLGNGAFAATIALEPTGRLLLNRGQILDEPVDHLVHLLLLAGVFHIGVVQGDAPERPA